MKATILSVCILLFTSLGSMAQGKVTILGSIKNSPNTFVYLVDDSDYSKKDSAAIDANTGTYSLSAKLSEERGYWLYFDKVQPLRPSLHLIANPGDRIEVNTDLARKSNPTLVKGSVATDQFHSFEAELNDFALQHRGLYNSKSDLVKQGASEAKLKAADKAIEDYVRQYGELLRKKALLTESPVTAFYLLDKLKGIPNYTDEQQERTREEVEAKFPKSSFLQSGLARLRLQKPVGGAEPNGVATGEFLPTLKLVDAAQERRELMDFIAKNKYTLIDVWASWCKPCREESPFLLNAYNKYAKDGFSVIAVSVDEKDEHWLRAIEKDQTQEFIHLIDASEDRKQVYRDLKLISIPANFIVDSTGRIVVKNLRQESLLKKLEELYQ